MATFSGSITVNDVVMTALQDIATARRVAVADLANAALVEYARGAMQECEQRVSDQLFPRAWSKATDAEKVAMLAQLKTIGART